MIGVRLNSFNDNSGEPEQDANSALTELDKGLRSGKVGEQCEAIVRFPRLFEKYPFPILINSSFLKLADVFRMGNNFLRLWVLRVCQQSEKHLDKILNVDEFLRRIYSVLHSNDSVARALALRTLGAVAGIIPERQNVHHAIRRGLDSHDNVEVEAAIYATTRFAAHSNAFAMAMCNKLSDMVECESTGPERRAKLVRALRTVHGGAVRAQGVLQLLRSLLERFPSSSSVRAAITALTAIANDTVVHVPDTVELLLSIATQDARSAVRKAAVLGLKTLASHAALWSPASIEQLVRAAQDSQDNEHTMLCLQVMQILVQSGCVLSADGARAALRTHCAADALSAAPSRAARACAVLAGITLHCYEENQPVEGDHLMLALEALVIATGADGGTQHIRPLRVALKCLVQLSKVSPADYAARTCATLYRELCGSHLHRSRVTSLLEALAALGGSPTAAGQQSPAVLFTKLCDTILDYEDGTALVLLCTVVFQERAARALTHRLHAGWQGALLDVVQKADGWTRYRVARAALRYGHHSLAAIVLSALRAEAPTETIQRWLAALATAAAADARLTSEGIASIPEVQQAWELACGLAREGGGACGAACGGCGACVPSAPALLRARACALAALAAAADAAHVLCSQPPPAVAQSARTPGARGGACEGAARAAARRAGDVSRLYQHVASTAFLADDTTLRLLYISQHTFAQLASFLERVVNQPEPTELSPTPTPMSLEEVIALAPSREIARIESKLFDNPTTGPGITHRHAEAILACVRALCTGSVWARAASGPAAAPLCRLALSPAGGKLPDHALPVPRDHRLALRLEGVLRLGNKKKMQREVKAVQITVTATPHPRTNEKTVELTGIPPVLTAVQTVTPVRDFFSAQQLVSVNTPGLYTVAVEAAFVDQHGELWKTGPRASIVIKANDDPSAKGNNTSSRSRF